MSKSILRRLVVVLALSALLGSPTTSLAGSRSAAARHPQPQAAAQAPLSRLWNALLSIWRKEGGSADPYRGRRLKNVQDTAEAGCSADPYGRCISGQ